MKKLIAAILLCAGTANAGMTFTIDEPTDVRFYQNQVVVYFNPAYTTFSNVDNCANSGSNQMVTISLVGNQSQTAGSVLQATNVMTKQLQDKPITFQTNGCAHGIPKVIMVR